MNKFLAAFCFIVLSFAAIFAQETKKESMAGKDQTAILKTEMLKLDKMVGKWSGTGWIQQGKEREEFVGMENVQWKVDGFALLVEGKFTDIKDSSRVIHETLAVLNYNPKTKIYDFQTYLASGRTGEFTLKVNDTNYEWGMNFPGGEILYTIKIKDGVWYETGKISRDGGKNWTQFFEMNLKKM